MFHIMARNGSFGVLGGGSGGCSANGHGTTVGEAVGCRTSLALARPSAAGVEDGGCSTIIPNLPQRLAACTWRVEIIYRGARMARAQIDPTSLHPSTSGRPSSSPRRRLRQDQGIESSRAWFRFRNRKLY